MRHLYEDADSGTTIEHELDWTGEVTITVLDENGPSQIAFPAHVLRDFVSCEFGGKLRYAMEKSLGDVFADAPVLLDDTLGDPEGAEAELVRRARERKGNSVL